MIDYYSKRAEEYEAIYKKTERQPDLQKLRDYLKDFFVDTDVLELACGTGYWTQVIAASCRSIVAVDASAEVLAIAHAKDYHSTSVQFIQDDVYDLGLIEGSFDAGLAAFWWSHVPQDQLSSFLRQFHSQLMPGARVCFIDNQYVEGSSTPISRTDNQGNTYQLRRLTDGSAYEVMKNFPSRAVLMNAVKDMGSSVVVEDFNYYWSLTYQLP